MNDKSEDALLQELGKRESRNDGMGAQAMRDELNKGLGASEAQPLSGPRPGEKLIQSSPGTAPTVAQPTQGSTAPKKK
jgi:hypothetical protein